MGYWNRRLTIATAVFISSCAVVPVASAVTMAFATSSSPQYVSGYGSWANAYGNWTGARISSTGFISRLSSGYYKYFDADNHTVYVRLQSNVSSIDGGDSHSSHDNVYSSSYTSFRSLPSHSLQSPYTPSVLRGNVWTCLDIPFRFDPCSSRATMSVTQ
jgi:hypothetical protein